MQALLTIPAALTAYSRFHQVDPLDVAQFLLEDAARDATYLLLNEKEDRFSENQAPEAGGLN